MQVQILTMGASGKMEAVKDSKLEVCQIFFLNGYGQDRYSHERKAIYEVVNDPIMGRQYLYVNLDTNVKGKEEAWAIKPIEEVFGIGSYYITGDFATPDEIETALELAEVQEKEQAAKSREAKIQADTQEEIGRKLFDEHMPSGAVGVIIACQKKDNSDPYSDYFAASTTRRVILAFTSKTKEDFTEMRRAAERFPDTANMGIGKGIFNVFVAIGQDFYSNGSYYRKGQRSYWHDELKKECTSKLEASEYINNAPVIEDVSFDGTPISFYYDIDEKSIEHREKYSGGNGYYLGESKYTGWNIEKVIFHSPQYMRSIYIDAAQEGGFYAHKGTQTVSEPTAPTGDDVATIKHNTQFNGIEIYFSGKPSDDIISHIKANGFRSKRVSGVWYWYKKISPSAIQVASKYGTIPDTLKG